MRWGASLALRQQGVRRFTGRPFTLLIRRSGVLTRGSCFSWHHTALVLCLKSRGVKKSVNILEEVIRTYGDDKNSAQRRNDLQSPYDVPALSPDCRNGSRAGCGPAKGGMELPSVWTHLPLPALEDSKTGSPES